MAVTSNTYTVGGSGQAGPYSYGFPILADTDIAVSVNGEVKSVTTHYTVDSGNTRITFVSGQEPSTGDKVIVYRDTDEDPIKSVFASGSTLRSNELNDNFNQLLYIVQENDNQSLSTLGGVMQGNLGLGLKNNLYFEGDTDDAYETTITVADPTADRTITLPNVTGTVVTTGDTGTVTSAMINDATIVNGDIANTTITGGKLVNDTITATQIAANAVTASELADDAVDTNAVADDAITYAKIQNVSATDRILGRDSSGAGIIEEITPANLRTMINVEDGSTGDQTNAEIRAAVEAATDSNVFTDADHTKLNGIETAATADQTISEIKSLIAGSPLDASHLAADSVTTSEIADAELTTLAGMQSGTASILADSTALTSTTAELNLLDGKSIVTTISGSSTDAQLPTAQAVDERITALVTDVGGFRPIANETSFPATNPDPEDNAGTIVSVKALASNLTSNGSGVATIANGAGSGNTVTINGMANSDTIEAGKGILVETTSTLHTYTFHRETLAPADVTAAKSAVDDFNQRYQVAGSTPTQQPDGTALAEGDLFFDTAANKMKVYDGSNYGEVTSTGDFKYLFLCPAGGSGAPTLTNTTFDLRENSNSGSAASVTNAAQLIVSVNGVIQKANTGTSQPAEGFAMVDANTIIFSAAPGAGASIFIHQAGSAVSIPVPGDNTVSTVKIQNLAVSTGKIADQAVDLTKLPHGDGSSNGKFLRSNNGADPTWETVAPGIGGATGVDFNDDVKARWGTDNDFEIFHDDSNSNLKETKGNIVIDGKQHINFNIDGTAKIQYGASLILHHPGVYPKYLGADGATGAKIELHEDSSNVSNKATIQASNSMSEDTQLTLPTANPTANGQALTATTAGVASWSSVSSTVADGCIYENDQTISNNYTIAAGKGAHSVGPITVNATVTVNGNWVVS